MNKQGVASLQKVYEHNLRAASVYVRAPYEGYLVPVKRKYSKAQAAAYPVATMS
jgi:hypothetical protein